MTAMSVIYRGPVVEGFKICRPDQPGEEDGPDMRADTVVSWYGTQDGPGTITPLPYGECVSLSGFTITAAATKASQDAGYGTLVRVCALKE